MSACACHELRDLAEHCEQLADQVDAGRQPPARLLREVARLRERFAAHHHAGATDAALPDRAIQMTPTSELRLILAALRSHLALR